MTTVGGQEVMLQDVTQSMDAAIRDYQRYIQYENEEDRYPDAAASGSKYYTEKKRAYAMELKRYLKGFKTGKIKRY
jgi:hypothetical protein